jgi:hypothetical protein
MIGSSREGYDGMLQREVSTMPHWEARDFMVEKNQHNRRPVRMTLAAFIDGTLLEGFERFVLEAAASEVLLIGCNYRFGRSLIGFDEANGV